MKLLRKKAQAMLLAIIVAILTVHAATIDFSSSEKIEVASSTGFGEQVAIDGVWAVVTAKGVNFGGNAQAHFFKKDIATATWSFSSSVALGAYQSSDTNGLDVAISGNWTVVGDELNDDIGSDDGKTYVLYKHQGGTDNWGIFQEITKDLGIASRFGTSVDVDNHLIVVGSMHDDSSGTGNAGGAYVYHYDGATWSEEGQLLPSVPSSTGFFGWDVAIHEPLVIVGAYNANTTGDAYIFHRYSSQTCPGTAINWGELARLTVGGTSNFGWSVDIDGYTAVVGSPGSDNAHVFRVPSGQSSFNGWSLEQSLTGSDTSGGDLFGGRVSLFAETLFVGARGNDTTGIGDGAVYRFERTDTSWSETDIYHTDTPGNVDNLGSGLGISSKDLAVGASLDEKAFLETYCNDDQTVPDEPGKIRPTCPSRVSSNSGAWTEQGFGTDVAMTGNSTTGYYAAVSQPNYVNQNPYITIYHNDANDNPDQGWVQQTKLRGPAEASFGVSIDMDGDYMVVHNFNDREVCGANGQTSVMIYKRVGEDWSFLKKVTETGGGWSSGSSTYSVSISGDILAVNPAIFPLRIYEKDLGGTDNWGLRTSISVPSNSDSVSVYGDTMLVGDRYDDDIPNQGNGKAQIYYRNQGGVDNWGFVKNLYSTNPTLNGAFGWKLDLYEDYAIVAASQEDVNAGQDRGAAYIFHRNEGGADNWGLLNRIVYDNGWQGFFGDAVAINNSVAIIGDYSDSSVHWYFRNGSDWSSGGGLHSNGTDNKDDTNDNFGNSVSLPEDNTIALVGNYRDDVDGVEANDPNDRMEGSITFLGLLCGNSAVDSGETCDDGNFLSGDGCTSTCELEFCGDNIVNNGGAEQCDGDLDCSGTCQLITICQLQNNATTEQRETIMDADLEGSLVIEGDYAFVSDEDGPAGAGIGTFHIFKKDGGGTWNYLTEIVGSDSIASDGFGNALTASGDMVVASAPFHNGNVGALYVFYKDQGGADNWGEVKKITASDGQAGDILGIAEGRGMSMSSEYIIVGTFQHPGGASEGAAYLFKKDEGGVDNWGEVKKLTETGSAYFGASVDIEGSTAVVAEVGSNGFQGSAIIFEKDNGGVENWGKVTEFTGSDSTGGDTFGFYVDLSGDTLAIGAAQHNGSAGAVYMFERNEGGVDNWGEITKVAPSDLADGDFFGFRLALEGDVLLSSASQQSNNAGAAYTFFRNQGGNDNWGKLQKITPTDSAADQLFGYAVDMSGDDIAMTAAGTAALYFYQTPFCPVDCGNGTLDAGEQCDDNNNTSNDGCSATCLLETCGDGVIQGGEQCDDSNTANGDGCSSTCQIETVCGDSVTEGAEECDGEVGCNDACILVCELPDTVATEVKINAQAGSYIDLASAVHLNENYVFIGNWDLSDNGQVDIYKFDGNDWNFVKTLITPQAGIQDGFGTMIDTNTDGSLVIIGAGEDVVNPGEAYIYGRDTGGSDNFGLIATLTASDGQVVDKFGFDVAIDGEYAVVGAYQHPGGAMDGAIYIYKKDEGGVDNWGELKKIPGGTQSVLGIGLDLENGILAAGEPGRNSFAGGLNVYELNEGGPDNWGLVASPTGDDTVAGHTLGTSVSIEGNTILVGQINQAVGTEYVYVFEKDEDGANQWGNSTKFQANDTADDDEFGTFGLVLEDDVAYVGAGYHDAGSTNEGAIYSFYRNEGGDDNWGQLQKTQPSDVVADDRFGRTVGASNGKVISNVVEGNSGDAAYIFDATVCTEPTSGGGGSSGGGGYNPLAPEAPRASTCDTPNVLNLPANLQVQSTDGKPSVVLNWYNRGLENITRIEVLRNGIQIANLNNSQTGYVDSTVEANICTPGVAGGCRVKQYTYTLRTRNACGNSKKGFTGVAYINPSVPDNVEIDVKADISLIVKEGFNTLFEEKLNTLSEQVGQVQEASEIDVPACSEAKLNYFKNHETRQNRELARSYITTCFDTELSETEIRQLVEPILYSQLGEEELSTLIQDKIDSLKEAHLQVNTYYQSLNTINPTISFTEFKSGDETEERDRLLCGGIDPALCTEGDRNAIEQFFRGSSQVSNIIIEIEDEEGNQTIDPIHTRTNIFGEARNLDFGIFLSGKTYTIKINLPDEQYVLQKIIRITIGNPVPNTVDGITTFQSHLNLNLDNEFCFGDFNEDGTIDISDILELKNLVEGGTEELYDVWEAINVDGLTGFDLLDMLTILKNFQCELESNLEVMSNGSQLI